MAFTESEQDKITQVAEKFPLATELAVAKIVNGVPYFFGVKKSPQGVVVRENRHAVFEVGSISKVLTSSLLAYLVKEQELTIKEPINSLFDFEFNQQHEISYQSLATHTSGLPRLPPGIIWKALFKRKQDPYAHCNDEHLARYLQHELKLNSNKAINYSNLGVGLLGVALAKYTGTPFHQLIKEKIFQPFVMKNTYVAVDEVNDVIERGNCIQGLDVKGKPIKSWCLGYIAAAGAVMSTVHDLAQFVLKNFASQDGFLAYQRQGVVDEKHQSMALGWFIVEKQQKGERFYFHNGGTAGFSSAMLMDIEKQNAFIVLSNISGLHKIKGHQVDKLVSDLSYDLSQ